MLRHPFGGAIFFSPFIILRNRRNYLITFDGERKTGVYRARTERKPDRARNAGIGNKNDKEKQKKLNK